MAKVGEAGVGAAMRGTAAAPRVSELRDFWTLLKPNVMQLVIFTSAVGLFLAPGHLHPLLAFTAILCIAAGAGASAAINNWYDADIDCRMARTRLRPTATGRIDPAEALAVGVTLAIFSVMVMSLALNYLAGALLAFTIGFYVFVYTMWLKRRTPQNIVIGGAAGALPPVVAWAAVTGGISLLPILLFLIIFLWTPPHFWALALYRNGDYDRVGVPMLPVVAGRKRTLDHILAYTVVLVAVTLLPALLGQAGLCYAAIALVLGGVFLAHVVRLWRQDRDVLAMRVFRFSIFYLFLLYAGLVVDRVLPTLVLG
ncbi:heme o synthase [Benzoatithermus flavus]|uniref:Protoheme IX farnesyltransferase n=1 Tax=Benzoatithermus flavus TaxID=3108223 RepID=A0ABU8XNS0_9PROT